MKLQLIDVLEVASDGLRRAELLTDPSHSGASHQDTHLSPDALGVSATGYAFYFALLSGVSLPIGAILGIKFRPDDETCSGWIALGAGALLFAVSVELYAHAIWDYLVGRMHGPAMAVLMLVSLLGSIFFTWITRLLEGDDEEESSIAGELDDHEVCITCGETMPGRAKFCFRCGLPLHVLTHNDNFERQAYQCVQGSPFPSRSTRWPSAAVFNSDRFGGHDVSNPPTPSSSPPATPMRMSSKTPPATPMRMSSKTPPVSARTQEGSRRSFGTGAFQAGGDAGTPSEHAFETGLTPLDYEALRSKCPPRRMSSMLRANKAQAREMARFRWKRLREAVMTHKVTAFLKAKAEEARAKEHRQRVSAILEGDEEDSGNFARVSVRRFTESFRAMKEAWQEHNEDDEIMSELGQMNRSNNRIGALKMYSMLVVDGIPEGILMGFLAAEGFLSTTLVLSFAIANFPEAFAGGNMMYKGGFSVCQIIFLWGGLMLMVGVFAGASCHLLLMVDSDFTNETRVPLTIQLTVSVMEGLAGGAMISGIAATMLPEAYERRNKSGVILTSSGFLCTLGFLLAVTIKITLG